MLRCRRYGTEDPVWRGLVVWADQAEADWRRALGARRQHPLLLWYATYLLRTRLVFWASVLGFKCGDIQAQRVLFHTSL